jgi:Zn-dependent protease with chaperone function
MKLYQAKYRVDCFPEALPGLLADEAELILQKGNLSEYQTSVENFGTKRYRYDSNKKELTISVRLKQWYLSLCILPIIFIPVCVFTDLFVGVVRDVLLLSQGLGCIGFWLSAMFLPKDQPELIYTDRRTAKYCRIPYLRQTNLRLSKSVFLFLILGLYAASPWIFPEPNLIVILTTSSIILSTYVVSRSTLKEQSTPVVLFLLMVSALPVWFPIGNIVFLTQNEVFRQQGLGFLQSYLGVFLPEEMVGIYPVITSNELFNILLINMTVFLFGAYYAPNLWDKIKSQQPWKPDEEEVSYNRKVHLALLFLYLSYGISSSVVLISYFAGTPVVPIENNTELVTVFVPTIVIGLVFTYYRCRKYLRIRREKLAHSNKAVLPTVNNKVEVLIVENLDNTAFSIDLVLAEPRIVINKQLMKSLDDSELAAVYFHEVYHIKSETSSHQRIANVPVIGPMFFLAFINPKEVHLEEFKADEFAAKRVGEQAVISAIQSSAEVTYDSGPSTATSDAHGIFEFLEFITTVPIVGIYRPTRQERVQNLRDKLNTEE